MSYLIRNCGTPHDTNAVIGLDTSIAFLQYHHRKNCNIQCSPGYLTIELWVIQTLAMTALLEYFVMVTVMLLQENQPFLMVYWKQPWKW